MGQSFVISGLREKRAELAGILADLERRAAQCRHDLVHLDATLRMFAPDHDPAALRPKQVVAPRSIYFQMGEVTKRIRDALREATEPLSAEAIAVTTMQDKGLDASDSKLRADFIRRILWALKRLATQGKVERVGAGLGVRWRLTSEAGPG
jgi:hypothetical protein